MAGSADQEVHDQPPGVCLVRGAAEGGPGDDGPHGPQLRDVRQQDEGGEGGGQGREEEEGETHHQPRVRGVHGPGRRGGGV